MSANDTLDFSDVFDADLLDTLDNKKRESLGHDETSKSKKLKTQDEEKNATLNEDNVLFQLQLKRNEARAKLRMATEDETKRIASGPNYESGKDFRERRQRADKFDDDLKEKGIDPERFKRLHETQEKIETREKQNKKGTNHHDYFSDDVFYKSFKRRQKSVPFSRDEYEKQKEKYGEGFYDGTDMSAINDKPENIDRMIEEMEKQEKRRKNFHRRRPYKEDEDVTYINEENRRFNIKVSRFYDKYTEDIRESVERGTAL